MSKRHSVHLEKSVDTGYALVILGACFIMYMFSMGCVKSFGILYGELQEVYEAGTVNIVSIGSTATFLQSILSPLANSLCMFISFRNITIVGGILVGLAFIFSSIVTDIWMMTITYSLLGGSMFTVLPAIVIEDLGLNNLPSVFGLVFFFSAIINVLGHPLLGWLKDISGKWNISFFVIGGLLMTSSGIVFVNKISSLLRAGKFKENEETTEIKDTEEKEMMLTTDK